MKTKKTSWWKIFSLCIALIAAGLALFFLFKSQNPEVQFRKKADLYVQSIMSGDFETALDIPHWLPERSHVRDQLKEMFEVTGVLIVQYDFKSINKLSDDLYQFDAILESKYGDTESFRPFYFRMDNKWYYAANEYQLPSGYLDGLEYLSDPDQIHPDGLVLYDIN